MPCLRLYQCLDIFLETFIFGFTSSNKKTLQGHQTRLQSRQSPYKYKDNDFLRSSTLKKHHPLSSDRFSDHYRFYGSFSRFHSTRPSPSLRVKHKVPDSSLFATTGMFYEPSNHHDKCVHNGPFPHESIVLSATLYDGHS